MSNLDFDIVSDFDIRVSSLWRTFYTTVENVRQINLFMQNKPNFPHFSLENEDFAKKQTQFKPNTNPIKANFGPISRVANPNKANSNPNKLDSSLFAPTFRIRSILWGYTQSCKNGPLQIRDNFLDLCIFI